MTGLSGRKVCKKFFTCKSGVVPLLCLRMPQVYFSLLDYRGHTVDSEKYIEIIDRLDKRHANITRYLQNRYDMRFIPGFWNAAADDFIGWQLHHVFGETLSYREMCRLGLYWHRPWWEFEFLTVQEHRKAHSSNGLYRCLQWGL